MAREPFFWDIRRAWGALHIPTRVEPIGSSLNTAVKGRRIPILDLCLSPKTVEEYRSGDYTDLDQPLRDELDQAVEDFRSIASSVASDAAVVDDQYSPALVRFEKLADVVQTILLTDWKSSVASIVQDASTWCKEHGWPDRLYEKELTENLLDTYDVPQLLFQAEGVRIELNPLARFVPGALGLIELRVVPSYDTVKMIRTRDGWQIHLNEGKDVDSVRVIPWDKPGFEKAVRWLRQHG